MEKYYQGYLSTKEQKYVVGLVQLLYPGGVKVVDDAEMTNCVMWFSYVKEQFSRFFRHFFKPAPVSEGKAVNWLEDSRGRFA